jgi:hypothetical protein
MDNLRLRLASEPSVFARLSSFNGFANELEHISFPADNRLEIALTSAIEYKVTIEGDANVSPPDSSSTMPNSRFYDVVWNEEAKLSGNGSAVLKLYQSQIEQPFIFELTMGEFNYRPSIQANPDSGSGKSARR